MDLTSNLPNEVLFDILAESAPYHSAFDHDLSLDPSNHNVWLPILRHKKSLLLVCKRWNNLASVLLFRHVVLRRPPQLGLFVHTLSNSRFGSMVQELTIAEGCSTDRLNGFNFLRARLSKDFANRQWSIQEHQKSIVKIPQLCPRLKRLSLRARIPAQVIQDLLANPNLFHITEFHFQLDDLEFTFDKLQPWLPKAACRIHQLSLGGFAHRSLSSTSAPLEFPNLEELRIEKRIDRLPENWSLPRLKRLILIGTTLECSSRLRAYDDQGADVELASFLRQNGSKIEYLSLLGCLVPTVGGVIINPILSLCPTVQRVAIDRLPVVRESRISFPGVKLIDVYPWDPHWTWDMESEVFADFVGSFPSLESVRILDSRPGCEHPLLLPTIEGDPIQVFKEACTWPGAPKIIFKEYTLERGVNAGRISILFASSQIDKKKVSDEVST